MKILRNLCLHFARQDGQDGKKREKNHATKVTKIPKTKRRKYGMNKTFINKVFGKLKYDPTYFGAFRLKMQGCRIPCIFHATGLNI